MEERSTKYHSRDHFELIDVKIEQETLGLEEEGSGGSLADIDVEWTRVESNPLLSETSTRTPDLSQTSTTSGLPDQEISMPLLKSPTTR